MSAIATLVSPTPATHKVRAVSIDIAQLFPECPGLSQLPEELRMRRSLEGVVPGVPARNTRFVQELNFLCDFLVALDNPIKCVISLFGPTGCGKSSRVRDFYARLNSPLFSYSCHTRMCIEDLIGYRSLEAGANGGTSTGLIQGPLYKALKNGLPLVLEEAFKMPPEVTSALHEIRDCVGFTVPSTGEFLPVKKGFKLILTSNQGGFGDACGMYGNDPSQDVAWLNGSESIYCGYLSQEQETAMIQEFLVGLSPLFATVPELMSIAPAMVKVANQARAVSASNLERGNNAGDLIEVALSTRDLLSWAANFVRMKGVPGDNPIYRALDLAGLRRAQPSTRKTVDNWIKAEFGSDRIQP